MSKRVRGSVVNVNLPPILGIFLTVFLDILGFGLFIPDLQLRGREFGASGAMLGFALGSFSLAQLLTSPFFGRISDRYGRRRVLLFTTILSCISYTVYANASSLEWLIASRIISGIAAANVGVAFAYVADITTPEKRGAGMGAVGAAFGLGFIFGPGIGALLLAMGHNSPHLLGQVGAVLAGLNFLYVWLLLPESAQHETEAGGHYLENFGKAFRTPGLALMLLMFFAAQFGFSNLETTFFQLLAQKHWIFNLPESGGSFSTNARGAGAIILTVVGIVSVAMQGRFVRILIPKHGEVKLLRFAYIGLVPMLALTPFLPLWIPMLIGVVLMGICMGLSQPSLSSLISRSAPKDMQGGVFGVTHSLGALARFTSPLIANLLFVAKPYFPYVFGAVVILVPASLAWSLRQPALETHARPTPAEA